MSLPLSRQARPQTTPHALPTARTPRKTAFVVSMMALSGLYLLNPTAGIFDVLPDNLPLIGNIDEGFAAAIFLGGLRYLGLDWLPWGIPGRR